VKKQLAVCGLAILLHIWGYFALQQRIEPFQYYFYVTTWWSYIMFVDSLLAIRIKRFAILNRYLPALVVISSAFWCVFELMNLRMQNWFYVNLPANTFLRYAGYILAYGTVVPAIYGTKELVQNLLGDIRARPVLFVHYPGRAIVTGFVSFGLALAFPRYCFPLAWVFLALILDGYNYHKGYDSFMKDGEGGSYGRLVATLLSGFLCGLLWEGWNFWSLSKWIYTVPFFENLKIFEMPIPGYLGFPVFAIETVAFVNLMWGADIFRKYLLVATIAALMLSFSAFVLIDRHTVFSYAARIDQLAFIDPARRDVLKQQGAATTYGVDVQLLNRKEREAFSLIHLKGLGYENFMRLRGQGICTSMDLSEIDEGTLSAILEEPNLERVRVFLKAAQKANRRSP
jgi:hypothetical protein